MKKSFCLSLLIICSLVQTLPAQTRHRYWDDVQTIKRYDKIYTPPDSPILFVGSSSIRKWGSLQRDFCDHIVMNRGIGGAVINDITYYADDIIFPYHPKQLIIFVGENDLPQEGVTADSVFNRFKVLYKVLRSRLPDIPIDYISIKPSPVRKQYFEKAKKANALISAFLEKEPNAAFIDIYPQMVTKEGKPRPELFVSDMLHMNAEGYKIWVKAVRPHLLRDH